MGFKIVFYLLEGRYITSIEIGVKLVQGSHYLKFLPGKYYLYKAGIASDHTW